MDPSIETLQNQLYALEQENLRLHAKVQQAEIAAQRAMQKYRALFDSGPGMITIATLDGCIVDVNASFLRQTGYTREEMMAWGPGNTVPWLDAENMTRAAAAFHDEDALQDIVVEYRTKWGEQRAALAATEVIDYDGAPHLFSVLRDVTDSQRAQEALQAAEEQFRQISDHLPEIIFLYDVAATRFIYVSQAYEHLWGRNVEDLYADSRAFLPAIAPEALPGVINLLDAMNQGSTGVAEFRARQTDGDILHLRVRTFPIFAHDGVVTRIAGITEDITPDVLHREQLREHGRRLEILHETAVQLNEAESQADIYGLLLAQLRQVIDYDSASVLLVSHDHLDCVASTGFPPEDHATGARIPLTPQTPSLHVVTTGEPVLIVDMLCDYPGFAADSPATAAKIRSWLGVPLIWRGRTIGQISLDRWRVQPFGEEEVDLATVMANHAAGAIERTRLHNEVLCSKEELERRVAARTLEIEQAQSSIRGLMERLELATRSAGIGIWDWDMRTGQVFWDENMRRIYGIDGETSATDLMGDWLEWIHPDDRTQTEVTIREVLARGTTIDTHARILPTDGSVRHVRMIATVLRNDALLPQRMLGVCTDITKERIADQQRAQTEDNLRQSEEQLRLSNAELERAGRLKDEFLANISHELRTPLNAILIIGESLQEEVYGPLTEKQQRALADVVHSGQHLLALINDILDLSKIEAGKIELQPAAVNISAVCQASLRLVREQAQKKGHSVTLMLPADALQVWADERRLKQMLVNLLSNAVKFTPDQGKIGLEVNLAPDQGEMRLAVWDTGIGIQEDLLPQLFQPFAQLDGALNRQYGGTGLGLALVRRLAELHGGHVEVQSTPGLGSRFTIALPLQHDEL
jgi:PAS domain S-box-containing protein